MAAARAQRTTAAPAAAPRRREAASQPARRPTASPRAAARPRARLPLRITVFVICLTLLAVGRVTLSFAVVQKNLQTDSVVREYRQLDVQNARLSEEVAGMTSSLKVHQIAVDRYGLSVPQSVEYVTVKASERREATGPGR
jgi:cell division protein FtsL